MESDQEVHTDMAMPLSPQQHDEEDSEALGELLSIVSTTVADRMIGMPMPRVLPSPMTCLTMGFEAHVIIE